MKRLLTVTMLAIALATTVSGCGTFRNWFRLGDECDPYMQGGGGVGAGPMWSGGAAGYAPAVPNTLPGPIEQVLPRG